MYLHKIINFLSEGTTHISWLEENVNQINVAWKWIIFVVRRVPKSMRFYSIQQHTTSWTVKLKKEVCSCSLAQVNFLQRKCNKVIAICGHSTVVIFQLNVLLNTGWTGYFSYQGTWRAGSVYMRCHHPTRMTKMVSWRHYSLINLMISPLHVKDIFSVAKKWSKLKELSNSKMVHSLYA